MMITYHLQSGDAVHINGDFFCIILLESTC